MKKRLVTVAAILLLGFSSCFGQTIKEEYIDSSTDRFIRKTSKELINDSIRAKVIRTDSHYHLYVYGLTSHPVSLTYYSNRVTEVFIILEDYSILEFKNLTWLKKNPAIVLKLHKEDRMEIINNPIRSIIIDRYSMSEHQILVDTSKVHIIGSMLRICSDQALGELIIK